MERILASDYMHAVRTGPTVIYPWLWPLASFMWRRTLLRKRSRKLHVLALPGLWIHSLCGHWKYMLPLYRVHQRALLGCGFHDLVQCILFNRLEISQILQHDKV